MRFSLVALAPVVSPHRRVTLRTDNSDCKYCYLYLPARLANSFTSPLILCIWMNGDESRLSLLQLQLLDTRLEHLVEFADPLDGPIF